ncbi:WD repeat-containing protein 73 [Pungitius pungitius]|uniref:WD repeat-containing protein 73 n=1 Tax=Pungitius pungitius TaxID=134920 RepID=UPI002E11A7FC
MEATDFQDALDDWFIESLKTYKDLHVYQLEHPTQVLEWTSGRTVCVAGHEPSRNEILELHLPRKLFADENKGLCAERDFKVDHGGFTDGPVRCLAHVPGTRCVVTNDGLTSDLQVWSVGGDESDAIRLTGRVEGRSNRRRRSLPDAVCRVAAARSSRVLHGAVSGDVRVTELTSGRVLYTLDTDSDEPLSSLRFAGDAVFLAGCSNGNVYVADTRTPAPPGLHPPPTSPGDPALWQTEASPGGAVLRLSACGRAVVSDPRSPRGAAGRARLEVPPGGRGPQGGVSWAPALDGCISVSGFGAAVRIYDTSVWPTEPLDVPPLFEHRGHAVYSQPAAADVFVTAHAWHPERPRTLLSAASDGSVHLWDWVDPLSQ